MPTESTSPATVTGATRLYGILGYPIGHSLSPLMHTLAFRHHGLDAVYVPFAVAPDDLGRAVAGAAALGVAGFNVTIPHKEAILACLDEVTDEASAIGAVNTVHVHDGHTTGHNTDGAGFLQPLQSLGTPLDQLSACVLGAGGAARALAAALLNAGCPRLVIANRTQARSERLAAELQKRFAAAEVRAVPMSAAPDAARQSRLIVNATSLGMHEGDAPPAARPLLCAGSDRLRHCVPPPEHAVPAGRPRRRRHPDRRPRHADRPGRRSVHHLDRPRLPWEAVRPALEARLA